LNPYLALLDWRYTPAEQLGPISVSLFWYFRGDYYSACCWEVAPKTNNLSEQRVTRVVARNLTSLVQQTFNSQCYSLLAHELSTLQLFDSLSLDLQISESRILLLNPRSIVRPYVLSVHAHTSTRGWLAPCSCCCQSAACIPTVPPTYSPHHYVTYLPSHHQHWNVKIAFARSLLGVRAPGIQSCARSSLSKLPNASELCSESIFERKKQCSKRSERPNLFFDRGQHVYCWHLLCYFYSRTWTSKAHV
jgi:hypothetical protein